MTRYWAWAGLALILAVGNLGCYYDQWQAAERANRVLQEKNAELQDDLHACELQNKQKDTMIASLNDQIATKDRMIASLTAEAQNLRDALAKAQAILEKNIKLGPGETVIVKSGVKLPEPLHKKLEELAAQHPNVFEYDAAKGAVRFKADLLFPTGKDTVEGPSESVEALNQLAEILNSPEAAGFEAVIVGHTDNVPIVQPQTLAEHKTNWHLSAHRAIAVMNLLAGQKVPMTRMGVMGYGEFRPIADNSTVEGKARNRRVEIYLVQKDQVPSVG